MHRIDVKSVQVYHQQDGSQVFFKSSDENSCIFSYHIINYGAGVETIGMSVFPVSCSPNINSLCGSRELILSRCLLTTWRKLEGMVSYFKNCFVFQPPKTCSNSPKLKFLMYKSWIHWVKILGEVDGKSCTVQIFNYICYIKVAAVWFSLFSKSD